MPPAGHRPASRVRLPRAIEADPELAARVERVLAEGRPLWRGGEIPVPRAPFTAELAAALSRAQRAGELGLEGAEQALAAEERGLRLAERGDAPRGARVSRLLLLADDGAERFYRRAESLLRRHAPRLLAVRLATDEARLGEPLFGPGRSARAVLLERKEAVAAALAALADVTPPGSDPARCA